MSGSKSVNHKEWQVRNAEVTPFSRRCQCCQRSWQKSTGYDYTGLVNEWVRFLEQFGTLIVSSLPMKMAPCADLVLRMRMYLSVGGGIFEGETELQTPPVPPCSYCQLLLKCTFPQWGQKGVLIHARFRPGHNDFFMVVRPFNSLLTTGQRCWSLGCSLVVWVYWFCRPALAICMA